MKIRGERECRDCGARWSYYETGEVACPSCGSLRSRGVDERTEHTDAPVSLDLSASRRLVESEGVAAAAVDAAERCREYVRQRGFVAAGDLRPLPDGYVAAYELAYVGRSVERQWDVDDAEELYLLALLRGADRDERPDAADVPDSMRAVRGLAYAAAVSAYRRDVRTYLDEHPDELARDVLGRLDEHVRRIEALDGEVPPSESERLVRTAQDVGRYLVEDAEEALATARDRLASLGDE